MQAERQKYETTVVQQGRGFNIVSERPVGAPVKFEFGHPGDIITKIIKSGYTSNWAPDFLKKKLKDEGTVARFYFDKKVVLDIGDPNSHTSKLKRKILFRHGFGYLCIPENYPQDEAKLAQLYKRALEEYYAYERLHPRPVVLQEVLVPGENGTMRKALITPIDIKVGVGLVGSQQQQQKEFESARRMTKKERREYKTNVRLRRALRRAAETGQPFRNPFIGKGKREFNVQYAR